MKFPVRKNKISYDFAILAIPLKHTFKKKLGTILILFICLLYRVYYETTGKHIIQY